MYSTTSNITLIPVNNVDCLPRGYSANYTRNNRTIMLTGEGDFYNCSRSLTDLLNLNVPCKKQPCSLNGVYQPKINYEAHEFYGFSEFWYTMEGRFDNRWIFQTKRRRICFARYSENRWSICSFNVLECLNGLWIWLSVNLFVWNIFYTLLIFFVYRVFAILNGRTFVDGMQKINTHALISTVCCKIHLLTTNSTRLFCII